MNEQIIERANILHQESQAIEEQIGFVEQQISELEQFTSELNILHSGDKSEILSSLGKGVYVRGNVEKKDFFVDVGAGVVMKKSFNEVQSIIKQQLEGLKVLRENSQNRLLELRDEFERIIKNIEKTR